MSREMDSINSKDLERQVLRDPSQDRYDGQRSGECYCDESSKI